MHLALQTGDGGGHRGHPDVGGASVEHHCEVLRGAAYSDVPEVLHLEREKQLLQFWKTYLEGGFFLPQWNLALTIVRTTTLPKYRLPKKRKEFFNINRKILNLFIKTLAEKNLLLMQKRYYLSCYQKKKPENE